MYLTLFTNAGVKAFAEAIDEERSRQLAKFGDQHHPDGTGPRTASWGALVHSDDAAAEARNRCQRAAERGNLSWRHVLNEEVAEAFAESDPAALRTELLQVAAVCAAWIYDIDQRPNRAREVAAPVAAPTTAPPVDTDRRNRYAAALAAADGFEWDNIVAQYPDDAAEYRTEAAAAMAVADTEQAALRSEVERLRTDRATVLREGDWIVEHCPDHGCVEPETDGCHCEIADRLRRLADEAQQPECAASTSGTCLAEQQSDTPCDTEGSECVHGGRPSDEAQQPETEAHEHVWTSVPGNGAYARLIGHTWTYCGICGQQPTPAPSEEPTP